MHSPTSEISIREALVTQESLLLALFGEHRPVLLLVDEVSKADDDTSVMKSIGECLDTFEECDVIVTALSPNYIIEEITESNKDIKFNPMNPLEDLGKAKCIQWANELLGSVGAGVVVNLPAIKPTLPKSVAFIKLIEDFDISKVSVWLERIAAFSIFSR